MCIIFKHSQVVRFADMAQVVEHILGKDEVSGSSPLVGSILYPAVVEKDFSAEKL